MRLVHEARELLHTFSISNSNSNSNSHDKRTLNKMLYIAIGKSIGYQPPVISTTRATITSSNNRGNKTRKPTVKSDPDRHPPNPPPSYPLHTPLLGEIVMLDKKKSDACVPTYGFILPLLTSSTSKTSSHIYFNDSSFLASSPLNMSNVKKGQRLKFVARRDEKNQNNIKAYEVQEAPIPQVKVKQERQTEETKPIMEVRSWCTQRGDVLQRTEIVGLTPRIVFSRETTRRFFF